MSASLNVLDISEDRVLVRAKGAFDDILIKVYPIKRWSRGWPKRSRITSR